MKINELKINSYGRLKDKNIEFEDGINIVYGENEKGKSTLLNCMVNMLYGTSKNKKGKDISDYDKYKPWDSEEFSGKMKYTLDNNESFEVFREFGKKNPKLYNDRMEDISKEYSIDKTNGNQFFFEQTKVDEQTFSSIVVSYQSAVELDNQTQNVLLQKIANTSSTGADNISFKKAIDRLNKKQLEEIGTNRSQGKPINIVINEMERINNENQSLRQYENYKYEVEDKKYKTELDLQESKDKDEFLNRLNNINYEHSMEIEKLKYAEGKIDEIEEQIQQLLNKKSEIQSSSKNVKKYGIERINRLPYIFVSICSVIVSIILYLIIKNVFSFGIIAIGVCAIAMLYSKIQKAKLVNKSKQEEYEDVVAFNKDLEKKIYEIDAQIDLLEKSRIEQIKEAEVLKNENLRDINQRKESLKREFDGKLDNSSMTYFMNVNNLSDEINQNARVMNEKNMELHRFYLDKQNILPKLEELVQNEEKLASYKEQYDFLVKKNNSINMAKEIIELAYQKMKKNVTPKFTQSLSENISLITEGKYNRIVINDADGILVELPNGEYKNANLLSKGTIEQLYLAFRLALIEDISEENMPIIFDEIFAYSDDNRLRETLKNIQENYSYKHQIILFTCTNREEKALIDLGCKYNKVVL
ncbi:MAG: AAA family ATPase [Clostridia bacterium]|nr:AAA family ATPase [Clostridia bacterium]